MRSTDRRSMFAPRRRMARPLLCGSLLVLVAGCGGKTGGRPPPAEDDGDPAGGGAGATSDGVGAAGGRGNGGNGGSAGAGGSGYSGGSPAGGTGANGASAAGGGSGANGGSDGDGGVSRGDSGTGNVDAAGAMDSDRGDGSAPSGALRIYWIDVEGGAATLLIAPSGETLLADTGYAGNDDRDARRIAAAMADAEATKIDVLLSTHYHNDHVGGVAAVARRFPVGRFVDHGASIESGPVFASYMAAIQGKTRQIVEPGDRLRVGEVDIFVVTSGGRVTETPLGPNVPNPRCAGASVRQGPPNDENAMSVGFVARFGKFDFLDLGDLTWAIDHRLACPVNRVGRIDLYQVSHHGIGISGAPQLVHAMAPLVAVMSNGAIKGGAAATFDILKASPGLQDIWQLHRAVNNDAQHNTEEPIIANPSATADAGHWIKATVDGSTGAFTVTNARNAVTRSYQARD